MIRAKNLELRVSELSVYYYVTIRLHIAEISYILASVRIKTSRTVCEYMPAASGVEEHADPERDEGLKAVES
jgi:hypothetical protein